jgi:hypothetical protein
MGMRFRPPFAVYWRNPKTRTFERIPNAAIVALDDIPLEIRPAKYAKWYTIKEDE